MNQGTYLWCEKHNSVLPGEGRYALLKVLRVILACEQIEVEALKHEIRSYFQHEVQEQTGTTACLAPFVMHNCWRRDAHLKGQILPLCKMGS